MIINKRCYLLLNDMLRCQANEIVPFWFYDISCFDINKAIVIS